ncbi:MAG: hypothetical protein MUD03_07360 [Pirellula sp.]|nr:hypothetical protein [Pirellula sp.]
MSNPYQFTTSNRIAHSKLRISAFWIGVRNGFLWSLLFAIPAAFAFYSESLLAMANSFDPVTFVRTRVPLTNSHRVAAATNALITVSLYITLPWSVIAGFVRVASTARSDDSSSNANMNHGEIDESEI